MESIKYEIGAKYQVKVVNIVKSGIIVELIDYPDKNDFIHISKISNKFVYDISKFVTVGSVYVATAISSKFKEGGELSLREDGEPVDASNHKDNRRDKSLSYSPLLNNHKKYTDPRSGSTLDDMLEQVDKVFSDKQNSRKSRKRRGI